jgi:hypothetical protein
VSFPRTIDSLPRFPRSAVYLQRFLPHGRASDWNQALMDYGALAKRERSPRQNARKERLATSNRYWRGRIIHTLRDDDTHSQ